MACNRDNRLATRVLKKVVDRFILKNQSNEYAPRRIALRQKNPSIIYTACLQTQAQYTDAKE